MMACRRGCKTLDHNSYIDCLRQATIQVQPGGRRTANTERELIAYADARRQGIQPAGTQAWQTREAILRSDLAGEPYDAGSGT